MGFIYTVVQGDCLSSIAARNGFTDWHVIYDHPQNAQFRQNRPNPNLIYPGDAIFIPDREPRDKLGATEKRHRLRVKHGTTRLKVYLKDGEDRPYANMKYVLTIDGLDFTGTTDGDGLVDQAINPQAKIAGLKVFPTGDEGPPAIWTLALGHLDPLNTLSGVQARLNNLGFDAGPVDGIDGPKTRAGVKAFQKRYGLKVDGIAGPITKGKLKEVYGC